MENLENYYGRWFTESQLEPTLRKKATRISSIQVINHQTYCQRCGSEIDTVRNTLRIGAVYCRACILLGRIRSDQDLYYFPAISFPKLDVLKWQGTLTPFQQQVSDGLLVSIEEKRHTLVHAVTGAGKTEMIYATIAKVIAKGGAVCIASPRIDVCLELYRRLKEDFSCPISLLHGESEEYFATPLVIATTHQLLKFYRAFDLLIVDEVDAFPYVDNPMLYHAVDYSIKEEGTKIFLTATSTDELDKKVKKKELYRLSLPRRFHGNPLIVPKKEWLADFRKSIEKGKLPIKLKKYIDEQRNTGFPLLLFVSEISLGEKFLRIMQNSFPEEEIGFVSSQTAERLESVEKFRNKEITILISTTILERGVTFPCVDVFVLESNHRLFSKSSLVQIAGRVGRSLERPEGKLYFFHDGSNHAIETAIREIKEMNQEAGL